jgi:hypothetical protein
LNCIYSAVLHAIFRLKSLKGIYYYPYSVPRNREDYPSAVGDEDDLDAISVEVLPVSTSYEGVSTDDSFKFDIFDGEITQYFINDEDLFRDLNPDSDYFIYQGGDYGQEDIEGELLEEEDMLFGSDWDSDDTMTNTRFVLRHTRSRDSPRVQHTEAEEIADVALQDTVLATEDGAQYFDADDLFEREDTVYEGDGLYSED